MTISIVEGSNDVISHIKDEDDEDICEICYNNYKCDNIKCKTCDKSICINCYNSIKLIFRNTTNTQTTFKSNCPYCRTDNNTDIEIFNHKELLQVTECDYNEFLSNNYYHKSTIILLKEQNNLLMKNSNIQNSNPVLLKQIDILNDKINELENELQKESKKLIELKNIIVNKDERLLIGKNKMNEFIQLLHIQNQTSEINEISIGNVRDFIKNNKTIRKRDLIKLLPIKSNIDIKFTLNTNF
jgi:hypothetical protein